MTCIIIEDHPPAQRILKKYIEALGGLELLGAFADAPAAAAFLENNSVELIFLDIHLPQVSGFEFLKNLPRPQAVILTTAFPDHALESYEFSVCDYLLKPFAFERFAKAVAKVPPKQPLETALPQDDLFIKVGHERVKINIREILFIKSDADYTEIVLTQTTATGRMRKLLSPEPLRYWEENLAQAGFVRVHKSYVVNTAQIEKIAGNQLFLPWGTAIPIGRAFKGNFIK